MQDASNPTAPEAPGRDPSETPGTAPGKAPASAPGSSSQTTSIGASAAASSATSAAGLPNEHLRRTTLKHLRHWSRSGTPFPMLTCYDATTAGLLYEAGIRVMLVGDTAAQMILGHDATLHAPLDFMLQITAGVRRGAPNALVMGDMPFGSYQCGDDDAMKNAVVFMQQGLADCVKLEVDASYAPLVERMTNAGVPVVAHIGSRPQHVRSKGGYRSAGKTDREASGVAEDAKAMLAAGACVLLIEAVPDAVTASVRAIVEEHQQATGQTVPVIGCGAGPDCDGHVVVLQDLLGLTHWQPAFARPVADLGQQVITAAQAWVQTVQTGSYLKDGGVYRA